jgi:hypothetical protein
MSDTDWPLHSVTCRIHLTLSNPIFLPPAYSPALIYFGRERGWWVTCNYPTVLKEKNININGRSTTCDICWLKSVLHEEKRWEQENHNVGRTYNFKREKHKKHKNYFRHYDF